jgi:hypothetical protein
MKDDRPTSLEQAMAIFQGAKAGDRPPDEAVRLAPEVIDLFRRGIAIQKQGKHRTWESEGGRRDEYIDVCNALHRMLGRRPWQYDVIDDDLADPDAIDLDPVRGDPGGLASAIEARRQLERYVPRVARASITRR